MYFKKSVRRAAGNPGVGIKPRDSVTLIDVDDISFFPAPDDKGVVMTDDIILKEGRYGYTVYGTPGTFELTSAAEGDTDQIGFTPSIKFNHPGNSQEVREFKYNSINRKFIIIVRYCSGRDADLIGTPCNPCKLTPSYTGNNDSNVNEFTFAQISKGEDIFIYRGTVPMEEPVSTVSAGASAVDFVAEGQYQLTAGDGTIVNVEGGAANAVITLLGVAGNAPAVNATTAGNIILLNGRQFSATEGSQLTLRAIPVADGKLLWVEQSRHEAV